MQWKIILSNFSNINANLKECNGDARGVGYFLHSLAAYKTKRIIFLVIANKPFGKIGHVVMKEFNANSTKLFTLHMIVCFRVNQHLTLFHTLNTCEKNRVKHQFSHNVPIQSTNLHNCGLSVRHSRPTLAQTTF